MKTATELGLGHYDQSGHWIPNTSKADTAVIDNGAEVNTDFIKDRAEVNTDFIKDRVTPKDKNGNDYVLYDATKARGWFGNNYGGSRARAEYDRAFGANSEKIKGFIDNWIGNILAKRDITVNDLRTIEDYISKKTGVKFDISGTMHSDASYASKLNNGTRPKIVASETKKATSTSPVTNKSVDVNRNKPVTSTTSNAPKTEAEAMEAWRKGNATKADGYAPNTFASGYANVKGNNASKVRATYGASTFGGDPDNMKDLRHYLYQDRKGKWLVDTSKVSVDGVKAGYDIKDLNARLEAKVAKLNSDIDKAAKDKIRAARQAAVREARNSVSSDVAAKTLGE